MTADAEAPAKRSTWRAIAVYGERRSLVMLALGFASGLPFLLIFDTLSLWLRDAGLSLEVIAFFSLATLAYSLKFLWAPLIDRTQIPGLGRWLGHRRSWMLLCQALVIVGLLLVAGGDPATRLGMTALFAVFVGFTSATQDIVIDAWRIESAPDEKQGAMAAAYQLGYRGAQITAGALPLILADQAGWNLAYSVMAGLMAIGVLGVLAAPREKQHQLRPIHAEGVPSRPAMEVAEWVIRLAGFALGAVVLGSGLAGNATLLEQALATLGAPDAGAAVKAAWAAKPWGVFLQLAGVAVGALIIYLAARPAPGMRTRPGLYLGVALGEPFSEFFNRMGRQAGLILALICLYRLSDFVLNIMNPFYADLGFTKTEIAEVRKIFGVVMTSLGVFTGGFIVARFGLMRALVIGAFAGPLSNLVFAWLTTQGSSMPALFVAIGVDNVASGVAGTALIAYMSSLTAEGFTATQYALFSSLYSLPGKLLASQSGRIVEGVAAAADGSGPFAALKAFFASLPPDAFAESMTKSGVSSAALGAGYLAFFIYSALIGVVGILLAFIVAARAPKKTVSTQA